MQRIYLDYAASTPVDEDVLKAMMPYFSEIYGNPSSVHAFGQEAQAAVDKARAQIAGVLGCLSQEVIFTGSATEANNLAILGVLREAIKKVKGAHVVTSQIEHESVLEPLAYAEKELGVRVTHLPVTKEGLVRPEDVKKALSAETVLVSIIYANNEIGTIQPIGEISKVVAAYKKSAGGEYPYLHTDAAQAAYSLPLRVADMGVDMMTISGHKIHAPKGVGLLYAKKGMRLAPVLFGSGHEYGKRSSTENVPYIVGLARALSGAAAHLYISRIRELRDYFISETLRKIEGTSLNGSTESRLPTNANILFRGVSAADLIMMLDMEGIAVSAGSACQSKALAESHVLSAIGLSKKDAKSSVRFSFGKYTTKEDVDRVVAVLVKLVNRFTK